jgi:AmmeMemoRadiSam system protein A
MRSIDLMLSETEKDQLKDLARSSIYYGLQAGEPLSIELEDFSRNLRQVCATFVTLHRHGKLRGCIGTVEASRPLVEDVVVHAYAAALLDPRFEPLSEPELVGLDTRISILSPRRLMSVASEQDLLEQLRPRKDGIVLELGHRGATFLPAVWEQLPNPTDFLEQLKWKAGLDPSAWDDGLRFYRYTTVEF